MNITLLPFLILSVAMSGIGFKQNLIVTFHIILLYILFFYFGLFSILKKHISLSIISSLSVGYLLQKINIESHIKINYWIICLTILITLVASYFIFRLHNSVIELIACQLFGSFYMFLIAKLFTEEFIEFIYAIIIAFNFVFSYFFVNIHFVIVSIIFSINIFGYLYTVIFTEINTVIFYKIIGGLKMEKKNSFIFLGIMSIIFLIVQPIIFYYFVKKKEPENEEVKK